MNSEGNFRADPWFIVGGTEVLDMGFGKPPKEFFAKKLQEGVILPGLVNAHSHLQTSILKKESKENDLISLNEKSRKVFADYPELEIRQAAKKEFENAVNKGTFFYNDLSTDPGFSGFLSSLPRFHGNRFLELSGFKHPEDYQSMVTARSAMEADKKILPTPHSVYNSSPALMRFVREESRRTTMSLHLFHVPDEQALPFETGKLYSRLQASGQYYRHHDIYHNSILNYLFAMRMLSFKKLFLVHLLFAQRKEIDILNDRVPHSAWVICHRSDVALGYHRKNLGMLQNSPIRMLVGTGSAASAGSVSVIEELAALNRIGAIPENKLLLAATFNAYEYLEIHTRRVPHFLFVNARPEIESLAKTDKVFMLNG